MNSLCYQLKCCFGPYGCSSLCIGPLRQSTTTRFMYSVMLIFVSFICTLIHERKMLERLLIKINPRFNETCQIIQGDVMCDRFFGYQAIYRIAYTFSFFHLFMTLLCIRINSSQDCRAKLHNGFWFFKVALIIGLWILLFLMPKVEKYMTALTITGVVAALLFIIIQDVSLIDCAYELNGYLREKGSRNCCINLLFYVITFFLYLATIGGYVFLYFGFAAPKVCIKNRVIIIINAVASVILIIFSYLVGNYNKNKLYIPGAVTCLFVTFLTWTAIKSAPYEQLPPYYKTNNRTDTGRVSMFNKMKMFNCQVYYKMYDSEFGKDMDAYVGILLMLGSAVYCSLKSTVNYKRYGIKPARSKNFSTSQMQINADDIELQEIRIKSKNRISGSHLLMSEDFDNFPIHKTKSMPSVSSHSSTMKMNKKRSRTNSENPASQRQDKNAKKKSVMIPKTIPDEDEILINELSNCPIDSYLILDEHFAVRYSYSWFHFIFALAYLFVMVQLTNWYSPETSHIQKFDKSLPSMWMKITTSWIALALYGWTLLCPAFCIGRRLYEYPFDSLKRYKEQRSTKSVST